MAKKRAVNEPKVDKPKEKVKVEAPVVNPQEPVLKKAKVSIEELKKLQSEGRLYGYDNNGVATYKEA